MYPFVSVCIRAICARAASADTGGYTRIHVYPSVSVCIPAHGEGKEESRVAETWNDNINIIN